jgi:hypothetical protein
VVRCGSKNWHQKELCLKETQQRAQIFATIVGSILKHDWGNLCDHFMNTKVFILIIMNIKMFMTFEKYEANGNGHGLDSLIM